jgi:cellobiose phosphorylase
VKKFSIHELIGSIVLRFRENDITKKYANEQPPLRAELFNIEQLERHGKFLANTHQLKKGPASDRLLKRLAGNEQILIEVRDLLTKAVKEGHLVTPAGEWLLDNFYLIEDNIHTGKRHLPKEYSASLPYLANTALSGLPRVYAIAQEIIAHSDGYINIESLRSFVSAYQSVVNLQLGELWAIPIMLRLALLENLRRISVRVSIDRNNQNLADYWATQMTNVAEQDPKSLILVIADMARSGPPMESSFVAELIRQLIWKGPGLTLPLTWMEQRLSETGMTSNELVNIENQKQAADQVSISNSINSLRVMNSIDWREFVEEMSVVEQTLRNDASGVYMQMDFTTRDRYRHVIESIAKFSSKTENEVAEIAIRLTEGNKDAATPQVKHVGYYLLGDGVAQTEKLAGRKLPFKDRARRSLRRYPLLFYAGSITLLSLVAGGYLMYEAYDAGIDMWLLILTGIVSVLAASHLATVLVNWITTMMYGPKSLPRLDFSEGIPAEYATIVVVPTMLNSVPQVEELVEMLEVRFLANRDSNLHFGLLTDFRDAKSEVLPDDNDVLNTARRGIEELNKRYQISGDKFFLFHRPRKWNPVEKLWMGYERKRGKLAELNALLRGRDKGYFSAVVGDIDVLATVRYVITLDTDTQLPHDAGWKLAGTMAHPLNHAVYDEKTQRVVKGYSILQPRVSVSLSRSGNSLYSLMHGNDPGIDPYTRLTSDVYQDLFEEGSFIGKGIYDVDAFETALGGRFPENRILSHDLLEGCYARAGLLTDVQFYEEYPARYSSDVNRRHRWVRGDWQIGHWVLPVAPDAKKKLKKNTLSALSRWKIFDNLRRSLVPACLTTLLVLGWIVFQNALFWTLTIFLILMLPALIAFAWSLLNKSDEFTILQHIRSSVISIIDDLVRNVFMFACLPYEAYYNLDAVLRTLWRLLISHKRLLEWNPSGNQEHTSDKTLGAAYWSMWFSPFIAAVIFAFIILYAFPALPVAVPVLVLWCLSPFIAWWLSTPFVKRAAKLSVDQVVYLRSIARRTWAFFETFVGPEDNWLPPDNYQIRSKVAVAHRTSPTNIGLSLLANLTAYDFGYIPQSVLLKRTANTLNTLKKMERYKGHFYNWYDTQSLNPLHPKYISTVDSGNLNGHLLTLRQGLVTMQDELVNKAKWFEGLKDTTYILLGHIPENAIAKQVLGSISSALDTAQLTNAAAKESLATISSFASQLLSTLAEDSEAWYWADVLARQCNCLGDELLSLYPWLAIPVPERLAQFCSKLEILKLDELSNIEQLLPELKLLYEPGAHAANEWLDQLAVYIPQAAVNANERIVAISAIEKSCADLADSDYDFLYDKTKHLLTIGYNVDEHRRDSGFYDLLASEASLCTYVAIAQGKLPHESWFALGRLLAYGEGEPMLLSWSGSMFEYLMPLLIMPDYENTLLHETHKNVVSKQISYGKERNIPWGISESGYNAVDADLNYQYRAFGVPGIGLKRGLAEDLVIAPYASVMALMVAPEEACSNMQRLSAEGYEGRYGLYEAIDYTPSRMPRGQSKVVIQSYMVHHQGMSLLSLAYVLLGQPMQKRFESELQFRSALLLLQERVPKNIPFFTYSADTTTNVSSVSGTTETRVITTPNTPVPEVQLLSNGKYHVMITNAGGGYSKWRDIGVTRWKEDGTSDNWGTFCYIRDVEEGTYWSNTYQPTLVRPKLYEVTYTQGKAEFRRSDNNIDTYTEIVVSPEDDMEMRRIHITNRSRRPRTIDVTTYGEVVLTSIAADNQHPAFSKLFVNTEILPHKRAIICHRRPRSAGEHMPWMMHMMAVSGTNAEEISFETDRMKFVGRGNTLAAPQAMQTDGPLTGSEGSVLDPIVSIRNQVTLKADETIVLDVITAVCSTRDGCVALIEKYQERSHKDRVFELAWTHSQVVLRQINATEADAQLYGQLASSIIFPNQMLRTDASVIFRNRRGQSGLWGYAVSGDLPIVLLEIEDQSNLELVKQLVQAHAYWRLKGIAVDLVIWNEDRGGYRQNMQSEILGLVAAGMGSELTDHPGGIFVRAADQVSEEDRVLFKTVARVNISDRKGSLVDQMNRKSSAKNTIPHITARRQRSASNSGLAIPDKLLFFNGHGGFSKDGKEYIIITSRKKRTPLPWVNILANPYFGSVISESGQSYTWAENAHELRLTPWENDPVTDRSGEAFYIRDEETGHYWSPAPLPVPGASDYVSIHGFGYSIFRHEEDGIESEMTVFVDIEAPVKFFIIRVKNKTDEERALSVTGYIEWVLGDARAKTGMHVITETDAATGALIARNSYNPEFLGRMAFFDTDDKLRTFTGDRAEFIGRNGSPARPDALHRVNLSNKVGAALDPCGAIQVSFALSPAQEYEVVFRLGVGFENDAASDAIAKVKGIFAAKDAFEKVVTYWKDVTTRLQVETPDEAVNTITNGWLIYQTIACRLWARSGYYQSGGAYGFRDQLQDVLSIITIEPNIARNQILLCASRQFKEGDVQHWWHPPLGRGVRTRCSDDLLWLPFVTCSYVMKTGDTGILDESVSFLEGRLLNAHEASYYDLPVRSAEHGILYEHCVRAIEHSVQYGEHGLPLIGHGDWNDGMDMIGKGGKGESVWLAFFLYSVLVQFAKIAKDRDDNAFAEKCLKEAEQLQANVEKHAWDGEWYRRAYFDDGTPLGSAKNDECRIDSISQSWAVLSGLGDPERTRQAIKAADARLVNSKYKLIQLLDPPFDKSALDPGYIKGYVPGIRENGGQYTHAAIWLIMAHANLGDAQRAWALTDMVNPINHGRSEKVIEVYKAEPYVIAADVYSIAPNVGRGGWTWYTGSAGWMYQLVTEWLLGMEIEGNKLMFAPCVPPEWKTYKVIYKYKATRYRITLVQRKERGEEMAIEKDGVKIHGREIELVNDQTDHIVVVYF